MGDLGSTNGGRRMDERKKKNIFFGRSLDFRGDFFFFFFRFLPSFLLLLSTISLFHDVVDRHRVRSNLAFS